MDKSIKIIGVILSGGAGERLGGVDKGLQHYQGKPLIEHVIERLKGQVDELIICANRNIETYEQYGYSVVMDAEPENYQGPLAGITSTIQHITKQGHSSNNHCLLISSCDSPNLPFDHAIKLIQSISESEHSSSVVNDGERIQNLHCVIKQQAWPLLEEFYTRGERAMYKWHHKNGSVEVDFSNQTDHFSNINTIQMLK